MKKPKNWDNIQPTMERKILPAGGYQIKILDAKVMTYKEGQPNEFKRLDISFDIIDGEYKGFFENDYNMQQYEDKRWKGVLRQYIPKDDGSSKDEWTIGNFKAMTLAVEDSNNNYHWDWDENSLKDKVVGCLFRNEEWEFDGRTGWKAQPFKFIPIEDIKNNNFSIPKNKPLKNKTAQQTTNNTYVEIEDDGDLPF